MKKASWLLLLLALSCSRAPLKVTTPITTLTADGYSTAAIEVDNSPTAPAIGFVGDHRYCHIKPPRLMDGVWRAGLQAGVMPGAVKVRVTVGRHKTERAFTLLAQITDSGSDGTPDFLRLDSESDREAFRFWESYLAEIQYFIAPQSRSAEITDCSALLRYAYREALRNHDATWLAANHLPLVSSYSSIQKYSYPHTPAAASVFRIKNGVFRQADLTDGAFAEFADAKTLQQFNTFFISRDISRAQPGDLLFYRRQTIKGPSYHSMVFLGPSKVKPDNQIYVIYHTGPDGTNEGEIRRLTVQQLLKFPDPKWQAISANPFFLGVYRWNILKALS